MVRKVITILGINGNVGSNLAQALTDQGYHVKGICRDISHAPGIVNVHCIAADLNDLQQASDAIEGSTIVYYTPPLGGDTPLETELNVTGNVIAACQEHNVQHLIAHTALGSDHTGDCDLLDGKHAVEEAIANSGIPYTILRPGYFMDNLWAAKDHLAQGQASMPWAGDRHIGMVAVQDIVKAAIGIIQKGPQNRGFDLHVPGGVQMDNVVEAAGAIVGKDGHYEQFSGTDEEFVDPFPLTGPHKQIYAGLISYFRDHDYVGKPTEIQKVLPDYQYTSPNAFLKNTLLAELPSSSSKVEHV